MTRKDRCTFFSLPAENEPAFLFPKSFYILLQNSSEKFFNFFEKTCQECVSEDIYRVKGIRVWVPAQATRQGRADIGTALLFPAVLPAVFDTRGRQGGGVSPARPVSFPRLRRGSSLSLPKKSFGISLRSESQIEF